MYFLNLTQAAVFFERSALNGAGNNFINGFFGHVTDSIFSNNPGRVARSRIAVRGLHENQ
jgi:hypothetical protein